MEEINRFVSLAHSGRFHVSDLCEQFGISRKTGYKYLARYAALGLAGLQPRSHRPHCSPQRTEEAVTALILTERRLHRTWGPKKNECSFYWPAGHENGGELFYGSGSRLR